MGAPGSHPILTHSDESIRKRNMWQEWLNAIWWLKRTLPNNHHQASIKQLPTDPHCFHSTKANTNEHANDTSCRPPINGIQSPNQGSAQRTCPQLLLESNEVRLRSGSQSVCHGSLVQPSTRSTQTKVKKIERADVRAD